MIPLRTTLLSAAATTFNVDVLLVASELVRERAHPSQSPTSDIRRALLAAGNEASGKETRSPMLAIALALSARR
jgi:hypothetical protein